MKSILLTWMIWCLGMACAMAQTEGTRTSAEKTSPVDSVQASNGSVQQDSVTQFKVDSVKINAQRLNVSRASMKRSGGDISALDTTLAGRQADSLLVTLPTGKSKKEEFVPDPIRSMWLGMVFPCAGQIYNRKYWKLPIFLGGYLGCVYAFSWNSQMLKDYSQAYLDIMDDDPETKSYEKMLPMGYDITGKEERFKETFKNKKNYFRKYRDMSIFAFAGVYLLSIIDAYVDAELSTFDISRDLSLHWEPASLNNDTRLQRRLGYRSLGVMCSLSF